MLWVSNTVDRATGLAREVGGGGWEERELALAWRWLDRLGDGPLSQADLAAAFEGLAEAGDGAASPTASAWLDGGMWAKPAPLREESAGISVIREEDMGRLRGRAGRARAAEIVRLTIPMPLREVAREVGGWRREGAALVVSAGRMTHSEEFGGSEWSVPGSR